MNLYSLKLKNFKGIKSFEVGPQGENVSIWGDNATGKTTLFDAFCWLLFGKDSTGKKDFEIKTLDAAGNPIHGLEHEVEGTFNVNGRPVTLRKVYSEKWTKKRGSANAEFTGHTVDHFIDSVPVQLKEYMSCINEIAPEEQFKLLTSPGYFNEQLHWQDRRKILLSVCGDLTDEEVIAADKALAKLPEILNGRKLDDHRKVIAARRAELNKELDKIPTRIDEVNLGLPDITGIDANRLQEDIVNLKSLKKEREETLVQIQSGGEVAQKKIKLSGIQADLMIIKNEFQASVDAQIKEKRNELTELELKIDHHYKRKIGELVSEISAHVKKRDSLKIKDAQLRAKWNEINNKQLEFSQDVVCPSCGQDLPEEKLTEALTKAEENFNREKAEKLEAINADGKANKEAMVEVEQKILDAETQHKETNDIMDQAKASAEVLRREIDEIRQQNDISAYEPYTAKLKEKADLERAIAVVQEGNSTAVAEVRKEITDIESVIGTLENSVKSVDDHRKGQIRIEQLKAQEKALAAEYEKLEGELYLCESFIKAKVSLLENKINSKFKYARFRLFETQINSAVVETCQTTFNGVPYDSGLNNAARIAVGLDIIATLSEHYGFSAPIFIDNCEAITKVPEIDSQLIRLYVSENDKKLRVELEGDRSEQTKNVAC